MKKYDIGFRKAFLVELVLICFGVGFYSVGMNDAIYQLVGIGGALFYLAFTVETFDLFNERCDCSERGGKYEE